MEANRIESTARGTLEHSLNSKWQQTNPVDNNSLPSESRSKSRRFSDFLNLRVGWKSKFWRFRASRGVWVGATVKSSSNFRLPLVLMNEFAQIVCDFDGIGYCSQWNWCILSMVAEWFNLKHQQNLNNANYCIFQCRNASWILSIVCSSSKMSLRSIQTAHATKFNGEYFYNSLADNSVLSK